MQNHIVEYIIADLNLSQNSITNTINLFKEGATIPFIARYRKEKTGNLDEKKIKQIYLKYEYYTELEKRKETVLKTIAGQGKLTGELKNKILNCKEKQTLEDIYLPYKPKKRTRATIAREKGLGLLADIMLGKVKAEGNYQDIVKKFINPEKEVFTIEDAINGAIFIIAEFLSEDVRLRSYVRQVTSEEGELEVKPKKEWKSKKSKYGNYYSFKGLLKKEPSHRILAIKRGRKEGVLSDNILIDKKNVVKKIGEQVLKTGNLLFRRELNKAAEESFSRLIYPSIKKEVFNVALEKAEEEAIQVFSKNLENILLAAPAGGKNIMGVDPGYRTGCKVAIIDRQGNFQEYRAIFPHKPQNKKNEASDIIVDLIKRYQIELIAIGNGTASKETDFFIREIIKSEKLAVNSIVVNEAGASVYSASENGASEFPDLDVTVRGAISIARRLQDPLAELVKIEPCSIGVGQYQHDMNQKNLKDSLDFVVKSVVNRVGVDLNTASFDILCYVSGINKAVAAEIVNYRKKDGSFNKRDELLNIPKMGNRIFEQCAGFLRIKNKDNPLDNSGVHPESYYIVNKMAADLNVSIKELIGNESLINQVEIKKYINSETGLLTLTDIINELKKPGQDPRKKFSSFSFDDKINEIADLKEGMLLNAVITNVTNFGAFADIGVHQDGLIHLSKLSNSFVKDPHQIVAVGDRVNVKVLEVDYELKRISLQRIEQ